MDRLTAAKVFREIAERGSMIAAAEALDMSRAMVTRYLAEMEEWCGVRLLHRTTRRVSLTAAGEQTLARCREMLAMADDMVAAGQADPLAPHGLLRVASSHSLAQTALAGAVAAFLLRHPRVSIDLQVDNRAVNLVEQRIDLAVRITNELDPGLIARRLGDCDSVVVAAPAYLERRGAPRTAAELAGHNCLTYSYFGKSVWRFAWEGESVQVPVGGNLSANESMALLAAAVEGAGVALQPRFAAAPLLADGKLVELLPDHRPQQMGIYGIYSSREHMPPALRAMLDHLLDWFASDPGWLSASHGNY
ncbi:LysR family transcriptional regulator [Pseudoduganella namucuonensis]|uniref:Transcriptional regulator, LysR family n=1 Tax=Pseudoduganella namucuonensis TaxID=1035707 RepID=A0A1I7LB78_9BURK|nr:LysR family transcriptional regulator [Pseudoduganella namucuonensis]SFV06977.1 transcriptional regulator, LysR family [Pseudoduganella namucuonensis]